MKRCCDVFNIHRSSYKYWAKQVRCIKPEKVKALAMVKKFTLKVIARLVLEPFRLLPQQEAWLLVAMLLLV